MFHSVWILVNWVVTGDSIIRFLEGIVTFLEKWTAVIGVIIGAGLTLILTVVYNLIKSPKLKYIKITDPRSIWIDHETLAASGDQRGNAYEYRLRIENKKKRLAKVAAENCICWVSFNDGEETGEKFQIPWIGGQDSTIINVEDYRDLFFCARTFRGNMIIPSIRGGYKQPIIIRHGENIITGKFTVTSSNGKKEEKKFTIIPIENNQLDIKVEKDP